MSDKASVYVTNIMATSSCYAIYSHYEQDIKDNSVTVRDIYCLNTDNSLIILTISYMITIRCNTGHNLYVHIVKCLIGFC